MAGRRRAGGGCGRNLPCNWKRHLRREHRRHGLGRHHLENRRCVRPKAAGTELLHAVQPGRAVPERHGPGRGWSGAVAGSAGGVGAPASIGAGREGRQHLPGGPRQHGRLQLHHGPGGGLQLHHGPGGAGTPGATGGIWGMPAYWNNTVYFGAQNDNLKAFSFNANSSGQLSASAVSYSPESFAFPGPTPSISANGSGNGILWAIQTDAYGSNGAAVLHAYDATNLANELYNSTQNSSRDTPGPAVKFAAA